MLTLNDGRSELWQWDTGRKLTVDADCSQVHFSNKVFGRSIDVDVVDGIADIPDTLLQTDKELTAWAFVGTAENGYTKVSKVFKVNKRNKPADYVFTEPDQTTLGEILGRIEDLENRPSGDVSKEDIQDAVNEYLDNNPVSVDEKDPTVPDWAKQPQKPTYTASEVGALPDTTKIPSTAEDVGALPANAFIPKTAEDVGAIPVPETATVGQTIVVKEVDGDGKPVAWECADLASGGSGDRWTKLGDVTVQATYEIVPLSFTAGIVTVDTTTEAYSWMSQYDKVKCVVHPIDITSKKLAPIVGILRKLDVEAGTFEFLNRDKVLQSTASYDPAIYKISVDNVASVEMTDIPSYALYKLRMTTPVLTSHGLRAFYSSTMTCLSMGTCTEIRASGGGIFEAETMRYNADPNYMYKHSRVSYGIWYGGGNSSEVQAFEVVEAGVGKTQPPASGTVAFNVSNMVFVNGTRFELWGANHD